MSNPKTTNEHFNTQMTLPLVVKEETPVSKNKFTPTFKPYNNYQSFFIYDLQELIPEHHVARVVDEMVEAIADDQLFAHYSGGGHTPVIFRRKPSKHKIRWKKPKNRFSPPELL